MYDTVSKMRLIKPAGVMMLALLIILSLTLGVVFHKAHADSGASITVSGSQMGISTQYIGVNSGTGYDSSKVKDVGFNSMRIWDDITEFEPTNDSNTYGSPSIDQVKNAGSNISSNGLIPWGTWDNNFSSYTGFFNQIKNDNIRLMISLRNTGNNHGQGWMQHQPPSTTADWNEWWEHVFAEVYWLNVRNNYHVDDWEVFNEPDNSGQGWNGTTQQYETFVQYTSDAIRYVYNTFLPGRTPYIYTSALSYPQAPANGTSGNWEDAVFSTVGNDFNAVSYHYYHSDGEFSNGINIAHSQANNAGHSNYPVWITEWGSYDETSSQQGIDPNCDSNEPCAVRMIDDMIRGSQPGDHYLTGSEYYVWGPGSYGDSILDGNSNPRTVYYALRLGIRALQGGKPTYQSSTSTSDLDAITTKDSSGNIYLLTTNTSGTNYNVNEDVSALFSGSSGTTIYRYDGSNSDSSGTGPAVSNGHVSFSIPANGAVLIVIPNGGSGGNGSFSTGFEGGQPQPTWTNAVDSNGYPAGGLTNVGGICCGLSGPETGTRNEITHGGSTALMYSGYDNNSNTSYAYDEVFDLSGQNIVVGSNTKLTYWIYPESSSNSVAGNYVSGSNSTCVAIDLIFSNGSNLRDSGAVDQNGNRAHPAYQCGHLTMDQWNQVTVNLGSNNNGKTIIRLDVGYDQPGNTGGYRGYIDDISIG